MAVKMNWDEKATLDITELMKVMAHPERIKIVCLLNECEKLSVNSISERLGLKQPETSRHLSVLKNKGVLLCSKAGTHSFYQLNLQQVFFKCMLNCLEQNTKTR